MGGLSTICSLYFLAHYKEAPITNRRRFIMLNSKQLSTIEKMQKQSVYKNSPNYKVICQIILFYLKMLEQHKTNILPHDSPYTKRAL